MYQNTLKDLVDFSGIGLHTGAFSRCRIVPASDNAGILIIHKNYRGEERIHPGTAMHVTNTNRQTSIGNVSTVEHLMAALWVAEIDNATIIVEGGHEVPILDGSAKPIIDKIMRTGIKPQKTERKITHVKQRIHIRHGASWVMALPSHKLHIHLETNFPYTGHNVLNVPTSKEKFTHEIAPARTFGSMHEKNILHAMQRGLGATKNNTIIFQNKHLINGPLRFKNEIIRHKALDMVGDLSLTGMHLKGHIIAYQPNHHIMVKLGTKIIAQQLV